MSGRRARSAPERGAVIGTPNDSGAIIAVAGEALIDMVPAPEGDYFEAAPGGSPANVAVGLARLGVRTRLLARIADDMMGRRVREHLTANGVELDHTVRASEQTSLAMVAVGSDGGATYDFRVDGTADWQWTPAELDRGARRPGRRAALGVARADHAARRRRAAGADDPRRLDRHGQLRPQLPAAADGLARGHAARRARAARGRRRRQGQWRGPRVAPPRLDARVGPGGLAGPRAGGRRDHPRRGRRAGRHRGGCPVPPAGGAGHGGRHGRGG